MIEISPLMAFLSRAEQERQRREQEAAAKAPAQAAMPEWASKLNPEDFSGQTRDMLVKARGTANQAGKADMLPMPAPGTANQAGKGDLELMQPATPMPMPKPAQPMEREAGTGRLATQQPLQPPMPDPGAEMPQEQNPAPASAAAPAMGNLRKELQGRVGTDGSYLDMVRQRRRAGGDGSQTLVGSAGADRLAGGTAQAPAAAAAPAPAPPSRGGGGIFGGPGPGLGYAIGGLGALMQEVGGQPGAMGRYAQAYGEQHRKALETNQTRRMAVQLGIPEELAATAPMDVLKPILLDAWKRKNGGGNDEYGLNPIYGTDKDGNVVPMQLSKSGDVRPVKLPDGVEIASGIEKIDMGTQWALQDKRTGQIVGYLPKDIEGAAAAGERGKQLGAAQMDLGGALQKADQGIDLIDQMIAHPGRETATGMSSMVDPRNYIAGTDATNFNVMKRQLQGKAFLEAFESLKGGGQITEVEGTKATEAIARLDSAQSDEAYLQALLELRGILAAGKERARQRAGQQAQHPPFDAEGNPVIAETGESVPPAKALEQARAAIESGAPREAVIERLKQMGIDPSGL